MSMIGKTLGNFLLEAQIGKGGMGEVYQAKDQKLGRDVAIKVLPEEFATDADRVARFQREAKLLASLNHPNIAAIHGLEEADGTHFLVLELIEGDTLADRLKRGAIPVEESLKLALQIAEALEAAHEKGVIHRDLKPANIKVTPDGKVKVLDFGLAKAFAGEQTEVNLSNSPTLSVAATQQGVILGTAAYMSPEQAKGKSLDKRTDVWAFGCVVFEMLTGRSVFSADDVSQTLARVLEREPDFSALPKNLHPKIREMLDRCMEKVVRNRYSSVSDARMDIQKVLAGPGGVFMQPVAAVIPRKKLGVGLSWITVTAIVSVIIAGAAVWYFKPTPPPEPRPVMRFDYELPKGQEFTGSGYRSVAVSADGRMIAYVANNQLYLKNSDKFTARPLQGTDENPLGPFFSSDGQWIGYCTEDRQLKKVSIMGGAPVTLCEGIGLAGATWGTDDRIVFSDAFSVKRVSAKGGTPEEIIKTGDKIPFFPQILPDGKSVLFSTYDTEGNFQVSVQPLESEERKDLFAGFPAQYLPTGHIVYGLGNSLTAIRFDPDTLEPIGSPVTLIEDVFRLRPERTTNLAISDSGTLVYIPGGMGSTIQGTLVWVDREGHEEPLEEEPKAYDDPKISPDGTQVALSVTADGNKDIYIYDLVRGGTKRQLTFDNALDFKPIWTPDGQWIIFGSYREGKVSTYRKKADGSGKVEEIVSVPGGGSWPCSISSDGNTLFFVQFTDAASGNSIGMLSMAGDDRTPRLFLQDEYDKQNPVLSPDGRWLAYRSNQSGQYEIFVCSLSDVEGGGKWQVSQNGGNFPLWSPDGHELFYRNEGTIMVVPVETEPIFKYGNPQMLFQGLYFQEPLSFMTLTSWDIAKDGKRFLMMKEVEATDNESVSARPRKINIVLNWFEELKEKVPTD